MAAKKELEVVLGTEEPVELLSDTEIQLLLKECESDDQIERAICGDWSFKKPNSVPTIDDDFDSYGGCGSYDDDLIDLIRY